MRAWIYDGSFDGLLTVIKLLLETQEEPAEITTDSGLLPLNSGLIRVTTNPEAAFGLLENIRASVSDDVAKCIVRVGLAERLRLEKPLFEFVRLALAKGPQVLGFHTHPSVRQITQVAHSVGSEIHRLKGLLRFRETADGWLWGPMAPDHNICVPVAHHFRRRMPNERWIIHDVARELAVAWDGHRWILKEHFPSGEVTLSSQEPEIQRLWRAYYREITIRERINVRRQAQHMPRRYWPYLVEKDSLADFS